MIERNGNGGAKGDANKAKATRERMAELGRRSGEARRQAKAQAAQPREFRETLRDRINARQVEVADRLLDSPAGAVKSIAVLQDLWTEEAAVARLEAKAEADAQQHENGAMISEVGVLLVKFGALELTDEQLAEFAVALKPSQLAAVVGAIPSGQLKAALVAAGHEVVA
jgi:hypothetical protein